MNSKCSTLLTFSLLLVFADAARAEGSLEVGANQSIQDSSVLFVDILASGEEIQWSGVGTLEVRDPNGVSVATLLDGDSYTCGPIGSYRLLMSQDQYWNGSWNIEVSGTETGFGRLYSTFWDFNAGAYGEAQAANGSFYALVSGGDSDDTAVVELRLDGLAGFRYSIGANATGVDGANAGRSVPTFGNAFTPQYRLYIRPPEIANYQTTVPNVTNFSYVGSGTLCEIIVPGESVGTFEFNSNVNGTVHLVCDTDQDGVFDPVDNDDVLIVGTAVVGTNSVDWNGTDNSGSPVELGNYDCSLSLGVGELHYVGDDIETVFSGLRMFGVTPNPEGGFSRTGLDMFWNDSSVQSNAVLMNNGEYGLENSGALGLFSDQYSAAAIPNQNARAWGHFPENFGDGKGDRAFLDTFANLNTTLSGAIRIEAVDGDSDCDGDGLSDFEEECVLGTLVCQGDGYGVDSRDSDADGVCDGALGIPDLCIFGPDEYPTDAHRCSDRDGDTCDDCSSGTFTLSDDGPDQDLDGICDSGEDTDFDGIIDGVDLDDDNDGIADVLEPDGDTDDDGLDNRIDLDSDGDTIWDLVEGNSSCEDQAPADGRCDGPDTNDDGLIDGAGQGLPPDTDGDGSVNFVDLDSDNDGALDAQENGSAVAIAAQDFDGDGVFNYLDLDSDNDGILDIEETGSNCTDADDNGVCDLPDSLGQGIVDSVTLGQPIDADSDELPDYLDWDRDGNGSFDVSGHGCQNINPMDEMCDGDDTDGDGIVDSEDGHVGFGRKKDTDGDGISDAFDDDDDGDSLSDDVEGDGSVDSDGDGVADSVDLDSDNDGLLDVVEARNYGWFAWSEIADTDGDGVPDFRELDSDNDGIRDLIEGDCPCEDSDVDGRCDGVDADKDGVVAGIDTSHGFGTGSPLVAPTDTDRTGAPDFRDLDSDDDGIEDRIELGIGGAEAFGIAPDSDGDGIADQRERDADGDGILDAVEAGPDLSRPIDSDGDGQRDFQDLDSDNDGVQDHRDNCPVDANPLQIDEDNNGLGLACDDDERRTEDALFVSDNHGGCAVSSSHTAMKTGVELALLLFALWLFRRRKSRHADSQSSRMSP